MAGQSTASILRISEAKTLQLIELYFNEECLWNRKIVDYKDKEKRNMAAEKVATILDLPNFTANHVMMKIRNLRNSYSQERKKIANSKASGAVTDDIYVPRQFWYSKMDSYLKPHLQGKRPTDDAVVYRLDEETEEWVQVNSVEKVPSPAGTHSGSEDDRSNDSSKKRKLQRYPVKRTKADITEQKSVSQALKDIQSQLDVLMRHNDDNHGAFGKYVASLLRSLPPQKALALQPKIVSLITGAEVTDAEELIKVGSPSSQDEIVMKFDIDEEF